MEPETQPHIERWAASVSVPAVRAVLYAAYMRHQLVGFSLSPSGDMVLCMASGVVLQSCLIDDFGNWIGDRSYQKRCQG